MSRTKTQKNYTYQFQIIILGYHGLDNANSITERQLGRNDQLGLGSRLACCISIFAALLLLFLLISVEDFVERHLQYQALVLLQFLGGCLRHREDTILGQMRGWNHESSCFVFYRSTLRCYNCLRC